MDEKKDLRDEKRDKEKRLERQGLLSALFGPFLFFFESPPHAVP